MTSKDYDIEAAPGCLLAGCLVWVAFLITCATLVIGKLTMMVMGL